jgi:hypothetical protein
MAKNAQTRSRQEKITLRETPVGSRVIRRLAVPNIDKSAELRRLIELGFACEQAGFILDGEVLRQAGRAWDIQPKFDQELVAATMAERPTTSAQAPIVTSAAGEGSQEVADVAAPPTVPEVRPADPAPVQSSTEFSELQVNLRALSRT